MLTKPGSTNANVSKLLAEVVVDFSTSTSKSTKAPEKNKMSYRKLLLYFLRMQDKISFAYKSCYSVKLEFLTYKKIILIYLH